MKVPDGTLGTVDFVYGIGQIQMKWDDGSSLALIYRTDIFQFDPSEHGTKYVIKVIINKKILYFKKLTTDFICVTTWDIPNCSETLEDATLFDSIEEAEEMCIIIDSTNFKIYHVCPTAIMNIKDKVLSPVLIIKQKFVKMWFDRGFIGLLLI